MWDTIVGNTDCSWEPVELRILKQELANMACKCDACVTVRHPLICHHNHLEKYDEGIQVDQKKILFNEYIYAEPQIQTLDEPQLNIPKVGNPFCSNCYLIWDLLRRAKKILKDEEAETTPDSSDKWTENDLKFADKTTSVSVINKTVKTGSSDQSVSDDSEQSYINFKKRTNHERVTFLEDFPHVDMKKNTDTMQGNCFCLQKFVDTIRPSTFDYHSYY